MDPVTRGVGTQADPFGWGEISTYLAVASLTALTPTASRIYYMRAIGAGPITKVGYFTSVSSGNCDVAVYVGGRNYAAPGARRASSGTTAMPVLGYSENSLTAGTTVQLGDYLAWGCDNAVARIYGFTGGGQGNDTAFGGRMYLNGTYPCPDPANGTASQGHGVALRGV